MSSTKQKKKTSNNRRRSIGEVARKAILSGKTNERALMAVMRAFPRCSSNLNCMAWYRSDLRRKRITKP